MNQNCSDSLFQDWTVWKGWGGVLGYYKDKGCKLTAKPCVKFEGEEGVGNGQVRQFLLCAMRMVQEGLAGTGKPVIFFEGEKDHKVLIHDRSLRTTGAFKAIGRIIGHALYFTWWSIAVWPFTSGKELLASYSFR